MSEWRLIVSYSLHDYDVRSTDALILGAVKRTQPDRSEATFGGSGAGFGQRDLEFYFASKDEAERVQRQVTAAGLPVALEFDTWEVGT